MSFKKNIQRGHKKSGPDPDSSIWIPSDIVNRISLDTHMGPRIDCAVLSCFGYHYKINRNRNTTIKYTDGVKIEVPKEMFVVSINTVAEDLYYRWHLRYPEGDTYKRFYEKVKKSVQRLIKSGDIKYLGYARKERRGVFGSVWTLRGTPLGRAIDYCDICISSGMFIINSSNVIYERDGLINVIDIIGGKSISKSAKEFKNVEMCSSYSRDPIYTEYLGWMNTVSNTEQRYSKHMTVGAFRKNDLKYTDTAPSYIPYIVIDIDSDNPLDGYDSVTRTLTRLDSLGANLTEIMACPTGGSGYHVYLPAGFFGNPIFNSSQDSKRILSGFFSDFEENIDKGVFMGSHLIRMIGSKHETSGLFKNAYSGDTFIKKHPFELIGESEVFKPTVIKDPSNIKPVDDLIKLISEYSLSKTRKTLTGITKSNGRELSVSIPSFEDAEEFNSDLISKTVKLALGEVSESEEWHPEKGYIGRSMALYVVSCHFLRKFKDEKLAWEEVKSNNLMFKTPPMGERELKGRFVSALSSLGHRKRRGYSWGL